MSREYTDPDLVAASVGVIECDLGAAIPGKRLRLTTLTPGTDGRTAALIAITSWLGRKGLYTLLTPEGARLVAADLNRRADAADAANQRMANAALAQTLTTSNRKP